jgi:ankyrin repeat protein
METRHMYVCDACEHGDVEQLLRLLRMEPDHVNPAMPPLLLVHRAAITPHVHVLDALVAYGLSVHVPSKQGNTPLHWACGATHCPAEIPASLCLDMVMRLLDHGADLHARNGAGKTPLCVAVRCGWVEGVRWLLHKGADPFDLGEKITYSLFLEGVLPAAQECIEHLLDDARTGCGLK